MAEEPTGPDLMAAKLRSLKGSKENLAAEMLWRDRPLLLLLLPQLTSGEGNCHYLIPPKHDVRHLLQGTARRAVRRALPASTLEIGGEQRDVSAFCVDCRVMQSAAGRRRGGYSNSGAT